MRLGFPQVHKFQLPGNVEVYTAPGRLGTGAVLRRSFGVTKFGIRTIPEREYAGERPLDKFQENSKVLAAKKNFWTNHRGWYQTEVGRFAGKSVVCLKN